LASIKGVVCEKKAWSQRVFLIALALMAIAVEREAITPTFEPGLPVYYITYDP